MQIKVNHKSLAKKHDVLNRSAPAKGAKHKSIYKSVHSSKHKSLHASKKRPTKKLKSKSKEVEPATFDDVIKNFEKAAPNFSVKSITKAVNSLISYASTITNQRQKPQMTLSQVLDKQNQANQITPDLETGIGATSDLPTIDISQADPMLDMANKQSQASLSKPDTGLSK